MVHTFVICLLIIYWIVQGLDSLEHSLSILEFPDLASKAFSRTVISSTLHSSWTVRPGGHPNNAKNNRRGVHMRSPLKDPAKHGSTQLHPRDLHLSWLKERLTEIPASGTLIQSTEISGQSVICQDMPGASTRCLAASLLPSCSAVLSFAIWVYRYTQHDSSWYPETGRIMIWYEDIWIWIWNTIGIYWQSQSFMSQLTHFPSHPSCSAIATRTLEVSGFSLTNQNRVGKCWMTPKCDAIMDLIMIWH